VAIEDWLSRSRVSVAKLWPKAAIASIVLVAGAIVAPSVLPLLPPEKYLTYSQALNLVPQKTEVHHEGPLPQLFGDQFGWPELVQEVAQIYNSLPAEERSKAAVLTSRLQSAVTRHIFSGAREVTQAK